jgi:EVE domain
MSRGDWVILYSPRVSNPAGAPLQAFTAIDQVVDDEPYQVSTEDEAWRRNVDFLDCVETPIRPLIDALDFAENKQRWGYKFGFGVFRINDHDSDTIRAAMTPSPELIGASAVSDGAGGVPGLTAAPPPNDTD